MTSRDVLVQAITREVIRRLRVSDDTAPDDRPVQKGGNMMPAPIAGTETFDEALAARIDHTLLRPEADAAAVDRLCDEARRYRFATVCLNPVWVSRAARRLEGSGVRVCTVVGFPLGAMRSPVKAAEAARAVANGATEIDMVVNVGEVKSNRADVVQADVAAVRAAIGAAITLKTILETASLTDAEKDAAARAALDAGADFLKTSTGFGRGGATEADVRRLAALAAGRAHVKASGGIRSRDDALLMRAAGAERIGASSSVAIVTGGVGRTAY